MACVRCGLTPRSSGAPTAGHQRPAVGTRYIVAIRALAAYRRRPLSSNVRPHNDIAPRLAMNYIEGKRLLLEFASRNGWLGSVSTHREYTQIDRALAKTGEVTLLLDVAVAYERKRNHTVCSWNLLLHANRLQTHALTLPVRESLASMPSSMRARVISLRQRLNGRVGYPNWILATAFGCADAPGAHEVDRWPSDEFARWLLVVHAAALDVASQPLPANSAEQLLRWIRLQRDPNGGAMENLQQDLAANWFVAPKHSTDRAIASAA